MLRYGRRLGFGMLCGFLWGCSAQTPKPAAESEAAPIVGGEADTRSRSILAIGIGNSGLCSGSLILPNLVLTARHCVAAVPQGSVQCGVSMFGQQHQPGDFVVTW